MEFVERDTYRSFCDPGPLHCAVSAHPLPPRVLDTTLQFVQFHVIHCTYHFPVRVPRPGITRRVHGENIRCGRLVVSPNESLKSLQAFIECQLAHCFVTGESGNSDVKNCVYLITLAGGLLLLASAFVLPLVAQQVTED